VGQTPDPNYPSRGVFRHCELTCILNPAIQLRLAREST
jgi:hypothetical protein